MLLSTMFRASDNGECGDASSTDLCRIYVAVTAADAAACITVLQFSRREQHNTHTHIAQHAL